MYDAERNIRNHRPTQNGAFDMDTLAISAITLANLIEALCPDGREKSLAFTNLEQTMMWARAAIARSGFDQRFVPQITDLRAGQR